MLSNTPPNTNNYISGNYFVSKNSIPQSAVAIEYTDFISAEGYDSPNEFPIYDTKQSDSEAPALELWGMCSTPSLPLLLSQLWPRVVAPDSVLIMGQIELFDI